MLKVGFAAAEEIGRGGYGTVYRCVELSLNRVVAVKLLSTELDEDDRARFLREQQTAGRFSAHPTIVQVLRVDVTASGRPFMVMPFHPRGSLDRRIRTEGALGWQEVLTLGVKLAGALATAHAAGVVHRDVTPANILITDYGEPQLADFGLARMAGLFRTSAEIVAGTPSYTAPEVLRGEPPTAAADVYGLGATLFTALTGHAAFARKDGESLVAQFVRIGTEPVPDLRTAEVPPALCSAIEAAMNPCPDERPGSAVEFGTRLRDIQFAAGLPVDALIAEASPPVAEGVAPAGSSTAQGREPGPAVAPITHYRPPASPHRLVDRPRLLRILREGAPRRLTLIHAPLGYGKSTLAAQWAAELAADDIPVAWLTLVPEDNNSTWCLARFVAAVRRVQPRLGGELAQALEEGPSDAVRRVLTTLINEIHSGGETVAVVVDDWHLIHDPVVLDGMRFLLDNACHHLRVIVTSRTSTGLPLARLRVRDELVEIDENALRFDGDEAEQLLLEVDELPLDRADADRLRDTTEGWAAALQLAALSLRGKSDPTACIDRISGHDRAIGEYLLEGVVEDLEPDLLEFLMRTSITDMICADLAETLTGTSSAVDRLEEVQRRNLFLRGVDDEGRWFRYHGLFADFLRDRLIRRHPGLAEQLHLTASGWFADHAMLSEAVEHALAGEDPERAVRIVVEHADDLLSDFRMGTFLALNALLPSALAEANPRLQLAAAWANLGRFQLGPAREAYERAEALLAVRPRDDRTEDLALESEIVRVGMSVQCDRADDLSPAAKQRLLRPVRSYVADAGAALAAAAAFYRFDFDDVRRWHEWTAPYRTRRGSFLVVLDQLTAAVAAFEQLDIERAERIFRGALAGVSESGIRSANARMAAGTYLAELLYQTGQFAEAAELVPAEEGDAISVDVLVNVYGTAARLAAVRGDRFEAGQLLDEGHRVAHQLALPRLSVRMLNERIRLGLAVTQDERRRLDRLGPYRRQPDHMRANIAELDQDSAIRMWLAEGSPESNRRAIEAAERMFQEIRRQSRPRALVQAQLLSGTCLVAGGRTEEAIDRMVPALAQCGRLGLVRFAIDSSGPGLAGLLDTIHDGPEEPGRPSRYFVRRLLDELEVIRGSR
ncbi:serine/threonine-protein kinase [Nocardia sp. alder85J]|uniref:serine/threonine-protein kinase n=1 Tax=Nocardia sp. alder85J TaxID=2862949 RepID=UPI001CD540B7|nr:serine/threonine-protein kinase [Nocardia sp. alder85J]MCX4095567.1 protein kinase [Nocardia sp. alder85J]